jgi:hypothetical protein
MINIGAGILKDLHIFIFPEYGNLAFGMPSACLSVPLASAWTVGRILFKSGV